MGEVDEGEEVFFYGEVEGVAVFEVCWDCCLGLALFSLIYRGSEKWNMGNEEKRDGKVT